MHKLLPGFSAVVSVALSNFRTKTPQSRTDSRIRFSLRQWRRFRGGVKFSCSRRKMKSTVICVYLSLSLSLSPPHPHLTLQPPPCWNNNCDNFCYSWRVSSRYPVCVCVCWCMWPKVEQQEITLIRKVDSIKLWHLNDVWC